MPLSTLLFRRPRAAALALSAALLLAALPALAGPAAPGLVAHRAGYTLSLHSAEKGSGVESATGVMIYEWADVCDGWTVQQRFELSVRAGEGDNQVRSEYITWESKDGRSYRFRSRQHQGGVVIRELDGTAEMPESGAGAVRFSQPEEKTLPLPPGTMFPTAHFMALMDRAQAGKRLFNRFVFDGTGDEGAQELNAVIAPARKGKKEGPEPAIAALTGMDVWPMRFAFFDAVSRDGQPNYELGIQYFANGVADELRLDFGPYVVAGTLSRLEMLPQPGC